MPQRPGQVTAAAVILIVLGVLVSLFGVLALLAAAVFPTMADSPEFRDQLGPMAAAAGIFVLSGRTWARIVGLIVAVLGILFSLVGVLPGQNSAATNVISLVMLLAYGFVAWILASRGSWFSR
jgi:hypothetical protein